MIEAQAAERLKPHLKAQPTVAVVVPLQQAVAQ